MKKSIIALTIICGLIATNVQGSFVKKAFDKVSGAVSSGFGKVKGFLGFGSSSSDEPSSERDFALQALGLNKDATNYEILGVSTSAEPNEIKKAYHKLSLKWHPDKNVGNEELATMVFKVISEAHEALK